MSKHATTSYDEATLERYLDGELGDIQARQLREAAEADPELAARLDEMRALRQLLQDELMAPANEVSFEGLADRVLAQVDETPPVPWTDRLAAWLSEIFTYRKPVWVPSLAVAAAAAMVLVMPRFIESDPQLSMRELAANAGVEVKSLETGTQLAMVYQLPSSQTTVIWIADDGDQPEESAP